MRISAPDLTEFGEIRHLSSGELMEMTRGSGSANHLERLVFDLRMPLWACQYWTGNSIKYAALISIYPAARSSLQNHHRAILLLPLSRPSLLLGCRSSRESIGIRHSLYLIPISRPVLARLRGTNCGSAECQIGDAVKRVVARDAQI